MAKKKAKKVVTKKTKTSKKTSPARSGKSAPLKGGLEPLGDRVVLRMLTEDEMGTVSPSGIIIPDTVSKEKPEQGIVVAVGAGKYDDGKLIPMTVQVGDKVVFSKYGYDEVKVAGKEYFIVSESNILAIIN